MRAPVEGAASRSEIERRLGLAPFAYVAEVEHEYNNLQQNIYELKGSLAFIDSVNDLLTDLPKAGSSLQEVAVSPDGTKIYVTDAYEPFLHVFDADSRQYIMAIELPGVEPKPILTREELIRYNPNSEEKFPYNLFFESCSADVACTPDGLTVLVSSSAGLQIINTETNQVINTIPEINGTHIAISFDGTRAYIGTDNLAELEARSYIEWFRLIYTSDEYSMLMLDLQTWEVLAEIKTYAIGGIAVRPDEPEIFFSETFQKKVRVVDAMSLEDLYQFSTEPSFAFGIGFLPEGSKAYTVCSADIPLYFYEQPSEFELPQAEEYFCLVFNTKTKQVIKKIPLDAY